MPGGRPRELEVEARVQGSEEGTYESCEPSEGCCWEGQVERRMQGGTGDWWRLWKMGGMRWGKLVSQGAKGATCAAG